MRNLINSELDSIKNYEKETSLYEELSQTFSSLKSQRNQAQNSTLTRVADHLQIKSKIKDNIKNSKKKRLHILNQNFQPEIAFENKNVVEKYEKNRQYIQNIKKIAEFKLKTYQEMAEKINIFQSFQDAYGLYEIISTFNKNTQLEEEISAKKKKIFEFSREKEALKIQLEFYKNKKLKEISKPVKFNNFEDFAYFTHACEKKFKRFAKAIKSQEVLFTRGKILIENCCKTLGITDYFENSNENIMRNLKVVIKRVTQFQNLLNGGLMPEILDQSRLKHDHSVRSTSALSENFTHKSSNEYLVDKYSVQSLKMKAKDI